MTITRFLQKYVGVIFLVIGSLLLLTLVFTKKEGLTNSVIPKVIMQTSKDKPEPQNVEKMLSLAPGWKYEHYTDDQIIEYFKANPLEECKNIVEKFYGIERGAHRADLFRYYYLYVQGGVFIDSDAMIAKDMNDIVKDYEFFTVDSVGMRPGPSAMFQGFIGCAPKNKIMYEALMDAYNTEPSKLAENYFLFCENMFKFVYEDSRYKKKIFFERELGDWKAAETYDKETDEVVLVHYYAEKVIP